MKTTLVIMIAALLLVSMIGAVSAETVIAGKVYDSPNFETANPVPDANIEITCNDNSLPIIQSLSDGTYSAGFETTDCPEGSIVTVVAEKDGVSNSETGVVHDYTAVVSDLYLGVVNIALIPEFGVIVGALTLIGAVGIFFVVRRK